jgi:hypothetical protein
MQHFSIGDSRISCLTKFHFLGEERGFALEEVVAKDGWILFIVWGKFWSLVIFCLVASRFGRSEMI